MNHTDKALVLYGYYIKECTPVGICFSGNVIPTQLLPGGILLTICFSLNITRSLAKSLG